LTTKEVYEECNEFHKGKLDVDRFTLINLDTQQGKMFSLTAFKLHHDKECVGYMICCVATGDTYVHFADNGGIMDKDLYSLLGDKEYYSIESNYDVELTYFSNRDSILKKRCLGYYGHSSNLQAIENVIKLVGEHTECVQFNHLSEETNSEELATKWHMEHLIIWNKLDLTKNIKFSYAKQNEIVPMDNGKTHKEIRGVR